MCESQFVLSSPFSQRWVTYWNNIHCPLEFWFCQLRLNSFEERFFLNASSWRQELTKHSPAVLKALTWNCKVKMLMKEVMILQKLYSSIISTNLAGTLASSQQNVIWSVAEAILPCDSLLDWSGARCLWRLASFRWLPPAPRALGLDQTWKSTECIPAGTNLVSPTQRSQLWMNASKLSPNHCPGDS